MADSLLGRCRFPPAGTRVDCAVSGGPDSVALAVLAVRAGLQATLIHVDHGIRLGSASEADVVAEIAQRLGAGFRAERVGIDPGPNLEARARAARYRVLPVGVMTGHTLDDQAETVLLQLLRGAGLAGLSGMNPADHAVRRPLLAIRRTETVALVGSLGLPVITDPSNTDPRHRRNRVRGELLPLLGDIAERDVAAIIARQADLLRDEQTLLDALAANIDPTDGQVLAAAPVALARRAVRQWLTEAMPTGYPPDLATVERVLAVARHEALATDVGGGWRITRHQRRLRLAPPRPLRLAPPLSVETMN